MAARVVNDGIGFVKDSMIPKLLAPESDTKIVEQVEALFDSADPHSIAVIQKAMADRHDFSDDLRSILTPTTIVSGSQDVITPATEMKQMAASIPNSTYHEIPNAGHLTPIENRSVFNQLLRTVNG